RLQAPRHPPRTLSRLFSFLVCFFLCFNSCCCSRFSKIEDMSYSVGKVHGSDLNPNRWRVETSLKPFTPHPLPLLFFLSDEVNNHFVPTWDVLILAYLVSLE